MLDNELNELSDADLEAAFKAAKAEAGVPVTIEDTLVDDVDDNDEVDELEQPDDVDSDDDTSANKEDESEDEDDSDADEKDLDEGAKSEKEQTKAAEVKSDEVVQPTQEILKVKANGQEYEFTLEEMKSQFGSIFAKAQDYTKKTQALKEYRKTIDIVQNAGISDRDLNLFADVLKGDKEAIATILKRTGVDALDLDVENVNYAPKNYGRNDTELAIKDIVDEISADKEYVITHNVLEKQWDSRSREKFIENPNMIKGLHIDIKSGLFDKLNPIMQKLKIYDGASRSDLDYYYMAHDQYKSSQLLAASNAEKAELARVENQAKELEVNKVNEVKAKIAQQTATKDASVKRKAAAPTKKTAGTSKINYLNDDPSDEEVDEWFKNIKQP
jgi:hypothetical protein